MSRYSPCSAQDALASERAARGISTDCLRWILVSLLLALPMAAQTVPSPTCSSARAVHDTDCPNYTGFQTDRLEAVAQRSAPRETLKPRSERGLSVPDGQAQGLRIGSRLPGGVASWYGPGFHGRLTANGERFNQNELTAAHKTLPFGARVLVESPRTGKQVVVRINDRGPFVKGRVIDLSKAAAQELGLIQRGHDVVVLRELLPAGGGSSS